MKSRVDRLPTATSDAPKQTISQPHNREPHQPTTIYEVMGLHTSQRANLTFRRRSPTLAPCADRLLRSATIVIHRSQPRRRIWGRGRRHPPRRLATALAGGGRRGVSTTTAAAASSGALFLAGGRRRRRRHFLGANPSRVDVVFARKDRPRLWLHLSRIAPALPPLVLLARDLAPPVY